MVTHMKSLTRRDGSNLRPRSLFDDGFGFSDFPFFKSSVFDSMIDDVFGSSVGARANVSSTETGSTIEIEAPGLSKSDFKVEVDENTLTVSSHVEKSGGKPNHREFLRRSFTRSFTLPHGVKAGDVTASYDAGILRIDIPHEQPTKREAVTIDIK